MMTVDSDDVAVVDERRHHAVRVQLEIGRVELITVQGHEVAFPLQPLFRQGQPRLLGTDGCCPVIEFKHGFLPVSYVSRLCSSRCLIFSSAAAEPLLRAQ